MTRYARAGHAYLVCPRLLELDARHGEHWSKGPPCRAGRQCPREHEHETQLLDPEGHRTVDFYWGPGADHVQAHLDCEEGCHDDLRCECGRQLVPADLDDPHDLRFLAP